MRREAGMGSEREGSAAARQGVATTRGGVVRVGLGLVLSAYGIYHLALIPEALHFLHEGPLPAPEFTHWVPRVSLGSWLGIQHEATGVLLVPLYAHWACMVGLAIAGIGVIFGHRFSMKAAIITLGVMVAMGVLFNGWGFDVAMGMGWVSIPPEWAERFAVRELPSGPQMEHYLRLGGWIALARSVVAILLQVIAMLYLRGLLRDREGPLQADTQGSGQT
jgi:hypothetical protein